MQRPGSKNGWAEEVYVAASEPCIFCEIVAGRAEAARIFEDDDVLVFLDLFPATPGHTLIIPKRHYENLFEADAESPLAVMRTARRGAHALRKALEPDGLTVVQLNGTAAGQTVFHYHVHLIPRNHGDELKIHGRKAAERAALDEQAARLAQAFAECSED